LRVLVVDDDARSLSLLSKMVMLLMGEVTTASGGMEALARLREHPFDLVITDQAMPGMTGDELARAAKSLRSGLPVIMVTGFGDMIEEGGMMPDGVDAVLSKPLHLGRMREALLHVVRSRSGPGEVRGDGCVR